MNTHDCGEFWVSCPCCLSSGPVCDSESKAVEAWNDRPEEDRLMSQIRIQRAKIADLERQVAREREYYNGLATEHYTER